MFHKFHYYISFVREKEYIQKFIIIAHFCFCQKVIFILLEIFLALKNLFTKYTHLKNFSTNFCYNRN